MLNVSGFLPMHGNRSGWRVMPVRSFFVPPATAPRLLLDLPQDRQRLRRTVADLKPVLLVLDPFIRLHLTLRLAILV